MSSENTIRHLLKKFYGLHATGKKGSEIVHLDRDGATIQPVKMIRVALGVADTAGGVLAWLNPEQSAIQIINFQIDITTAATGGCTLDFGAAANATTSSDTLINGVNSGAAIIKDQASAGTTLHDEVAEGAYITGSKATGAAAGQAGFAYITYAAIAGT